MLTVTGKYGRKRLIALHPSAAAALSDYLRFREQHAADGTAALLIGQAGRRLGRSVANPAFRSLATGCGLEPQPGCRSPRLHDFRHYADGWVMRPAVTFPLAGAAELVLRSA